MVSRVGVATVSWLAAIGLILVIASEQLGPNGVSYTNPLHLIQTLGFISLVFVIPVILALFHQLVIRIISGIYQLFLVFVYLFVVLSMVIATDGILLILVSIICTLVCLTSAIVTFAVRTGRSKRIRSMALPA
ncbi:hypothetical protein [Geomicrobium sp. JCM 19055]|uniref:hypothetical protein n=1 Tax=Geomicrobium sp. JCM 19055 TaxID=1460649 RepID=UPI00045ED23B|nr:hypothetical protein [Geomicrobium sp. JCM 19055]GAJ98938.1 hypothetical protein JCM19055_1905 [Geomicrobium sp. JCM 19055]